MNKKTGSSLGEQLTSLVRSKAIEADDLLVTAQFTLDTFANMLAGFNSEVGRRFLQWAHPRGFSSTYGSGTYAWS